MKTTEQKKMITLGVAIFLFAVIFVFWVVATRQRYMLLASSLQQNFLAKVVDTSVSGSTPVIEKVTKDAQELFNKERLSGLIHPTSTDTETTSSPQLQ